MEIDKMKVFSRGTGNVLASFGFRMGGFAVHDCLLIQERGAHRHYAPEPAAAGHHPPPGPGDPGGADPEGRGGIRKEGTDMELLIVGVILLLYGIFGGIVELVIGDEDDEG